MRLTKKQADAVNRLQRHEGQLRDSFKHYIGRYVVLKCGWRKGERGAICIIDSVTYDYYNGVSFLCMAVNKYGEIKNSDSWTREFRDAEDFELLKTVNFKSRK